MVTPLLTSHDATGHIHLIVGANPLAGARCDKSLEVGARPVVVAPSTSQQHYALQRKIEDGRVRHIERDFGDEDLTTLGREEVSRVVDAVFVTLPKKSQLAVRISQLCRRLRIPVNVADAPNLCSFSLLSTHSDGPLHIGITTSGKGCKLASRIKREVASTLPPNFGEAIERLGAMRRRIWEQDYKQNDLADRAQESDDELSGQKSTFNQLVTDEDEAAAKTRRIRWLSQICEYWPLRRLASITDDDVERVLESYTASARNGQSKIDSSRPPTPLSKPHIVLAGSGPGSPLLLTVATHRAIQSASVILADKLVPAAVLDLIPRRTPVHIARKFPGNADAAQEELLTMGLEALKQGHVVLRLKQGDPYVYGRGGEEYAFFERHGYKPVVLPGITSALSAPLFAGIPCTHRAVADQVLICTGTGRKGAALPPPPYVPSQTVVFLMALHRLQALVESLSGTADGEEPKPNIAPWPRDTPCAVIERASCADQRVIRSSLRHIMEAVEEEGSRPPGLLVVGRSCEVLKNTAGAKWILEDGYVGFDDVLSGGEPALRKLMEAEAS